MLFVKSEDISKYEVKGRRNGEPLGAELFRAIGSLQVGEGVVINKSEWPYKAQPTANNIPHRFLPRGASYHNNTLVTENGWLIRRVK
jgi:hypothetical protein